MAIERLLQLEPTACEREVSNWLTGCACLFEPGGGGARQAQMRRLEAAEQSRYVHRTCHRSLPPPTCLSGPPTHLSGAYGFETSHRIGG